MYSELWSIVDRGRAVFTWFFELIFFSIRLVFAGCRGVRAASRVVGRSIGPPVDRFFRGRFHPNALAARPSKFID